MCRSYYIHGGRAKNTKGKQKIKVRKSGFIVCVLLRKLFHYIVDAAMIIHTASPILFSHTREKTYRYIAVCVLFSISLPHLALTLYTPFSILHVPSPLVF